ncbi:Rsd/AlgQ family anti-sigma factor [Teredinibacter purpureus]|jgi:Regulator of sigma D|uniref:Rsd/AlgQ family anti-sigma factor n=1 Tax=Teredinibacter purpureus TaxID=2731756 RepID=UPI0005F7C842|nr:Rsd/AlgQ family anti-sigma factor [Teredinibacter purpureus]
MLENCKTAQERWGGVTDIIDRWLGERQQVLVLYCQLSEIIEEPSAVTGEVLRSMCQLLVDYVSAGHFEIYDQLVQEAREFDDKPALTEAKILFTDVDKTTEYVLDFNDKYQEIDDLDSIETDLSKLGETLAHRFEAEDRAIEVLHTAHKDQVA